MLVESGIDEMNVAYCWFIPLSTACGQYDRHDGNQERPSLRYTKLQ